jgi:hypothetical protein
MVVMRRNVEEEAVMVIHSRLPRPRFCLTMISEEAIRTTSALLICVSPYHALPWHRSRTVASSCLGREAGYLN